MTPRVSVILPTHNRADTLAGAVFSVLRELPNDGEVIIVDDGSTDHTGRVVAGITDIRVRYHRCATNSGPARARNIGVTHASGNIIAFQDSDDVWLPGRLKPQLAQLTLGSADVSFGRARILTNGRPRLLPGRRRPVTGADFHRRLMEGNFVPLPAVCMRRDVFERVGGFDEDMRCLEDWDLWLRVSAAHSFAFVDRVVVDVQEREDGVNQMGRGGLEAISILEDKHAPYLSRRSRSNFDYLRAHVWLVLGDQSAARRAALHALADDPTNPKAAAILFASLVSVRSYRALRRFALKWRDGERRNHE